MTSPRDFNWTAERVDRLKMLWADGWSAADIAFEFGTKKNAVMGKITRLKLPPRDPEKLSPQQRKATKNKLASGRTKGGKVALFNGPHRPNTIFGAPNVIKSWNPPVLKEEHIPGTGILLLDFEDHPAKPTHCRWPLNSPERGQEYFFCGKPIQAGECYCLRHCRIAFPGRYRQAS